MGSRQRWTIEPHLCLPPAAPRRPRMRRFRGTAAVDPTATAPQRRDHNPIQTWIWAASLRPTGPERLPTSRNSALRRADYWHGSASAAGKRSAVAFAQVRRPGPPHQQCGADAGNAQGATQVAPLSRRSTQYCVRKNFMTCGAPLRNRTVDLLLTMYSYSIPSLQVRRLTCEKASADQHQHALDGHSRAQFATRSATRNDLQQPGRLRGPSHQAISAALSQPVANRIRYHRLLLPTDRRFRAVTMYALSARSVAQILLLCAHRSAIRAPQVYLIVMPGPAEVLGT